MERYFSDPTLLQSKSFFQVGLIFRACWNQKKKQGNGIVELCTTAIINDHHLYQKYKRVKKKKSFNQKKEQKKTLECGRQKTEFIPGTSISLSLYLLSNFFSINMFWCVDPRVYIYICMYMRFEYIQYISYIHKK